jgi:hypothetical protein
MKLLSHRALGIHLWTKVRKAGILPGARVFILRQKRNFPLPLLLDSRRKPDEAREASPSLRPQLLAESH